MPNNLEIKWPSGGPAPSEGSNPSEKVRIQWPDNTVPPELPPMPPPPDDPEEPPYNQGDMLYWDATYQMWVKLPAPAAGYWVLTHNGTVPSWVGTFGC